MQKSADKIMDDNLLQLRLNYSACLKLSDETDSKKEYLLLRKDANDILENLKRLCNHNYTVILSSEYEGSHCMDYDDCSPEQRKCLMCGTYDAAYKNNFNDLTTNPFARFERKYPDQINNPLKYLLSETLEIAKNKGYKVF